MLTTDYLPGTPIWLDLGTPDIPTATAFYGALFGWEFRSAGPEAGGYGMFTLDGKVVAAAGPLTDPGARTAWTSYFHTADADATAAVVTKAGGTVRLDPDDVFDAGRMAGLTDPTGAEFAVWQPARTKGLDVVTLPGSLCWSELYTTAPARATEFYREVFGWVFTDSPMPTGDYTVVMPANATQDRYQGGIAPLDSELAAGVTWPHWLPYFEVTDTDLVAAEAKTRGGALRVAPYDSSGVGRMAMLSDPAGAPFAIITSVSG